jgi:hypothetical protein
MTITRLRFASCLAMSDEFLVTFYTFTWAVYLLKSTNCLYDFITYYQLQQWVIMILVMHWKILVSPSQSEQSLLFLFLNSTRNVLLCVSYTRITQRSCFWGLTLRSLVTGTNVSEQPNTFIFRALGRIKKKTERPAETFVIMWANCTASQPRRQNCDHDENLKCHISQLVCPLKAV